MFNGGSIENTDVNILVSGSFIKMSIISKVFETVVAKVREHVTRSLCMLLL